MSFKYFSLTFFIICVCLLAGCSQTPEALFPTLTAMSPTPTKIPPTATELPPTPSEPTIIWSDELGASGWQTNTTQVYGFGTDFKIHESETSTGTWSFDVFIQEKVGDTYYIAPVANQERLFDLGIQIKKSPKDIIVKFTSLSSYPTGMEFGESWRSGEMLTGWHHFDITRDNDGNTKVYLDGETILEATKKPYYRSVWFIVSYPSSGRPIKNFVVWDQVIDIQPVE
jgi:hypothetical protein